MRPTVTAHAGRHPAAAGVGSPPMRQRFTARAVVVGDRGGTVVPDAAVDVEDGTFTWVGPAADAPDAGDAEVVAVPGVLLPGLVNAHSHAPMVLFRGQAEGLPLARWLREVIWPREARLTPEDVEVAMTAASAEMLRGGVPTSVEMYFSPERIATAVGRTGARAVVATPLLPLPGMPPLAQQLADAVTLATSVPGDGAVEYGIGPHAAYTLPLPVLRDAAAAAREHGLLLHLHVAETAGEGADLLAALRLAAGLARLREGSATALTAAEAFWLATGGAADAIGRPDLGQVAVGRRADLVHVDTRDLAFEPVIDPVDLLTHLVWSGTSRLVRDTWVGGRQLVRDGVCTKVDAEALRADVAERGARLAG